MKKTGITSLAVLSTVAVLLLFSGIANAQGLKIGFITDDRIYQEYPAWQKAQEDWETERKAWEEEATTMRQELQDMYDEYDKQKLILSDEKKREREAAIRTKEQALDAFTKSIFGPGGKAEVKQTQLVQPLLDKIHKAIEKVAIDGNYDVIFTLQGIGYIKDSYDVTDEVLKALDELED